MPAYIDETFTDETINLDDNTYEQCKFYKCIIVYSGGALPTLNDNLFDHCQWRFEGAAKRTLIFMAALYGAGAKELVDQMIEPIRNPSNKPGNS